jgi:hypothetical protein
VSIIPAQVESAVVRVADDWPPARYRRLPFDLQGCRAIRITGRGTAFVEHRRDGMPPQECIAAAVSFRRPWDMISRVTLPVDYG